VSRPRWHPRPVFQTPVASRVGRPGSRLCSLLWGASMNKEIIIFDLIFQ